MKIERYFTIAATHGVTGTHDQAAQSVTMYGTMENSGGRGEKRVAGGESTRARLQYLSAPESGGRQPRTHHDLNDPLLLGPQLRSSVLGTALLDTQARVARPRLG